MFDIYDDNKDGVLETITAGKMLMDLYRAMNKEFHPTATDIASYARIFDRENKGKITLEDMERFVIKYYCNDVWSFIKLLQQASSFVIHTLFENKDLEMNLNFYCVYKYPLTNIKLLDNWEFLSETK